MLLSWLAGIANDLISIYSQDCIQWHLLPHAGPEIKAKCSLLEGRFTGDPSFEYEHTVTHRVGDGENAQEQSTSVRSIQLCVNEWSFLHNIVCSFSVIKVYLLPSCRLK